MKNEFKNTYNLLKYESEQEVMCPVRLKEIISVSTIKREELCE
ncbi:hypothetical protein [Clostridium perfringens]|nr:hypothetical protein [Clostridium perfringens]